MRVPLTHKQRDSIIFQRRLTLLCRPNKQHELIKWRSHEKFDSVLLDVYMTCTCTRTCHLYNAHMYKHAHIREHARILYVCMTREGSTLEASGHVRRIGSPCYACCRTRDIHHSTCELSPLLATLATSPFRQLFLCCCVHTSVCGIGVLVIIITRDKKNEAGERNSRDQCVDLLSVFPCNQTAGLDYRMGKLKHRERNLQETYQCRF